MTPRRFLSSTSGALERVVTSQNCSALSTRTSWGEGADADVAEAGKGELAREDTATPPGTSTRCSSAKPLSVGKEPAPEHGEGGVEEAVCERQRLAIGHLGLHVIEPERAALAFEVLEHLRGEVDGVDASDAGRDFQSEHAGAGGDVEHARRSARLRELHGVLHPSRVATMICSAR
jgi:hypothetical protein